MMLAGRWLVSLLLLVLLLRQAHSQDNDSPVLFVDTAEQLGRISPYVLGRLDAEHNAVRLEDMLMQAENQLSFPGQSVTLLVLSEVTQP